MGCLHEGNRAIEAMTTLLGVHPKYIGWVPVERVLQHVKMTLGDGVRGVSLISI